jgi:ABC-type multidrug transport system ATPase subunit/ABC-type polysaccharide/polyol phosphate export permease
MTKAICVKNLTKRFENVQAITGISFDVEKGELFGFLGPNGAGKTTTINMLTGLARPDSGSIEIGGIDCTKTPRAAQHLIGVVPDESNLYPELSGFENLCFCAALYGMGKAERQARARELLDAFGLTQAADRKFGGYSKGMKRKLTIAAGIIHRPEILFLDEPTTGIDVASARQVRKLIADLHTKGTTIFLTTHYIEEAERLCRRIAFIVFGRIVGIDTVENLVQPILDKHGVQITGIKILENMEGQLRGAFPDLDFLAKDMRTYYLKPPIISWGLIFPLAWTGMFFIKYGSGLESISAVLPGVVAVSILFGTTSMLAVAVTFEKKQRSFERLLLAPLPFELLMLAKTSGAILFGVANGFVPVIMAAFFVDLSQVAWGVFVPAVFLISVTSTFLGLFIAVAVSEVFEAQTFSNFFRFPMIFLCGLFFPIERLPVFLKPLSYALPLTYGADVLHGTVHGGHIMPFSIDLAILGVFCIGLFLVSLRNIRRRWIV